MVWGRDLGRARRLLVLSILSISILGRAAYWAKPKLNDWLFPPPRPALGVCTNRIISMSGDILSGDIAAAKKWARIETQTKYQGYVWNQEKQRVELFITDGETIWQIELICFEIKVSGKFYVAQFGEFEKLSVEESIEHDDEIVSKETGL